MSAKQQKCCVVQQTLLMDFLQTKKKEVWRHHSGGEIPAPPTSWVLFWWNMRGPLPTKMAGLNLVWGWSRAWGPFYCTFKHLTESVHIRPGLLKISQSEQIKSECPYSLMPTLWRRDNTDLTLMSEMHKAKETTNVHLKTSSKLQDELCVNSKKKNTHTACQCIEAHSQTRTLDLSQVYSKSTLHWYWYCIIWLSEVSARRSTHTWLTSTNTPGQF